MKYKYILFDMGNTIVKNIIFDNKKALEKLYQIIDSNNINFDDFINVGIQILNENFKNRDLTNIEIPYRDYIKLILDKFSITNYDLEYLELEMYKYSVIDEQIISIRDWLNNLVNDGFELYVMSNATFSSNCLKYTLSKFGILEFFCEVYSSADVIYRKPSKLFFYECEIVNKVDINKTIFVGNDEYFDQKFAQNIGVPFVLCKLGKCVFNNKNKDLKEIFKW